jgi:hypothetical protein
VAAGSGARAQPVVGQRPALGQVGGFRLGAGAGLWRGGGQRQGGIGAGGVRRRRPTTVVSRRSGDVSDSGESTWRAKAAMVTSEGKFRMG